MHRFRPIVFALCALILWTAAMPAGLAQGPIPPSIPEMKAELFARPPADRWLDVGGNVDSLLPENQLGNGQNVPVSPVEGAVAASAPEAAEPDVSTWSRMVFQAYDGGNKSWEIVLADGAGTPLAVLAPGPAQDTRPRLNRGADTVLFESNRDGNPELYSVRIDGGGLARLTFDSATDVGPAWSPDGSRFAFYSNRSGNYEIYVANRDGSGVQRITNHRDADITPTWSPDGTELVWVRRGTDGRGQLYLIRFGEAERPFIDWKVKYLANPSWSAGGDWIVVECDIDGDYWTELYKFSVANPYQLGTYGSDILYDARQDFVDVSLGGWTPDAMAVVFTRVEYVLKGNELYLKAAYVQRISPFIGTGQVVPVTVRGAEMQPDWQTTDVTPPDVRVNPLPEYTRGSFANLTWRGGDTGGSGIYYYDLQYRTGEEPWITTLVRPDEFITRVEAYSGQTVSVRMRGRDRARNAQPWSTHPNGDTSTKLYYWELAGAVRDVRGTPVTGAAVTAHPDRWFPTAAAATGSYLGHTIGYEQTVGVAKPGYGALPLLNLYIYEDSRVLHVLPPTDNLVQNGGFEAAGSWPWGLAGETLPQISAVAAHSGAAGALLRSDAFPQVVTQIVSQTARAEQGTVLLDRSGYLHVAWQEEYIGNIVYTACAPGGGCAPVQILGKGLKPWLAEGPDGRVHLAWYRVIVPWEQGQIIYRVRSTAGAWGPDEVVVDFGENGQYAMEYGLSGLVVDGSGATHVLWSEGVGGLYLRDRQPDGAWAPIARVPAGWMHAALAVTPVGDLHIAFSGSSGSVVRHIVRAADGTWGLDHHIGQEPAVAYVEPKMVVDSQGVAHIVWMQGDGGTSWLPWYARVDAAGVVSQPELLDLGMGVTRIALAAGDRLVVATESFRLAYRNEDGSWSAARIVMDRSEEVGPYGAIDFQEGTDQMGLLYYRHWKGGVSVARYELPLEPAGHSILRQQVTIPADMHRPTLSFLYRRVSEDAPDKDPLSFVVETGTGAGMVRTLLTPSGATDAGGGWTHAWFDMAAFAGQTVTFSVDLASDANGRLTSVSVDEVSLGSAVTPTITGLAPRQVAVGAAATVRIMGDNFMPADFSGPLRVWAGRVEATRVQWLDERMVEVDFPALPVGAYAVRVVNPGDQEAVAESALLVGEAAFVPLLAR